MVGLGENNQTVLPPLNVSVPVSAGCEHSFYVYSSLGVRYTNGASEGSVYASNEDIVFHEGKGVAGPFSYWFSPRVWNGIIEYCA